MSADPLDDHLCSLVRTRAARRSDNFLDCCRWSNKHRGEGISAFLARRLLEPSARTPFRPLVRGHAGLVQVEELVGQLVREGKTAGRLHWATNVHGYEPGIPGTARCPEHAGVAEPVPQDEDVELVFQQSGQTSQWTRPCQLATHGERRLIPGLMRVPLRRALEAKALGEERHPEQLTGLRERTGAAQPLREGFSVMVVEPGGTWAFEDDSGIERRGNDRCARVHERGARYPECVCDAHQLSDPKPSLARLERLDAGNVHLRQRCERRYAQTSLIAAGADAPTEIEQAW
jgi:hypothetical protein